MVELLPAPEDCGLPVASDILPLVEEWIAEVGGIEQAFKIVGTILLYSGPQDDVSRACRRITTDRNHDKVRKILKREPEEEHYTFLDRTKIGLKFEEYGGKGVNLFSHLKTLYAATYKELCGRILTKEEREYSDKIASSQGNLVMTQVSEMFINAAQGDVETCVCGADLKKVFYTTELPALMNNKRITMINGVDIQEYRKVYFSGDEDAKYSTFTLICQNELSMMHDRTLSTSGDEVAFVMEDYSTRKLFFEMEQKLTADKRHKDALAKMEETKTEIEGPTPSRPAKVGKIVPIKKIAGLH